MAYIEIDAEYLWALEVVACDTLERTDDPDGERLEEARGILSDAPLRQPMDRV